MIVQYNSILFNVEIIVMHWWRSSWTIMLIYWIILYRFCLFVCYFYFENLIILKNAVRAMSRFSPRLWVFSNLSSRLVITVFLLFYHVFCCRMSQLTYIWYIYTNINCNTRKIYALFCHHECNYCRGIDICW